MQGCSARKQVTTGFFCALKAGERPQLDTADLGAPVGEVRHAVLRMQSAYLAPFDTPVDEELAAVGDEEPHLAITAAPVTATTVISTLSPSGEPSTSVVAIGR